MIVVHRISRVYVQASRVLVAVCYYLTYRGLERKKLRFVVGPAYHWPKVTVLQRVKVEESMHNIGKVAGHLLWTAADMIRLVSLAPGSIQVDKLIMFSAVIIDIILIYFITNTMRFWHFLDCNLLIQIYPLVVAVTCFTVFKWCKSQRIKCIPCWWHIISPLWSYRELTFIDIPSWELWYWI